MRTKVTLVLIFLNVVLFGFIFYFEPRWRTEDSWMGARHRVLGAESADIRTLQITGSGRDIALTKRSEGWFITKPIEWPANPNAVSRIINELQFLEHETSFQVKDLEKNGQSLADYGLDHPRLTVAFTAGDGGPASLPTLLRLGDTTKDGVRLYLLSPDGERIHVVSQSLAKSLSMSFDELRSDSIFSVKVFEARSLNLQTAAPANLRIRLRWDGTRWTFEAPFSARASKNDMELTINELNKLRVKSFVTQNPPASLPSDKPELRISLEGNNRRETLLLGDAIPAPAASGTSAQRSVDYYAQLEGRAALFTVTIPAELKSTLDNAQVKLRETRILEFDPRSVTAITLTAPNQSPLTLQRLETGEQSAESAAWQIVLRGDGTRGPQTLPADRTAVSHLLEQLSLLAAKVFQSDAPRDADLEAWGFNRPEREISLTIPSLAASGSTQPVTLQIGVGSQRDGLAYARTTANPSSIFAIDSGILRETQIAPRVWRDRLIRELPAGARITALKLTDIQTNQVLLDTAIDASGKPVESTPDVKSVETVLANLRVLRAKEFVLDEYVNRVVVGGDERPWRYRLEATVTLVGGAGEQTSTTTLMLTPRVGGDRQLAGSPANEFNAVFALEQPLLDALFTLTEAPRDPGPPPQPAAPTDAGTTPPTEKKP
jgi:hypothetical protein